jgi:iron complex outermembrane recepter protein
MSKKLTAASLAALAGVWACASSAAQADSSNQTADAGAAASDTVTLQTVTVTAQRRTQDLENVPIAVTSFSGDQLTTQQITSTQDLEFAVPNLFAANNVGQGSANVYYIRALGQTQSFPTFEPQVSTYIDDVYLSRQNANNFALFGVQQVQVLNGPQGTLFGRNSTGGAILVSLLKPGHEFGGDAELSYGQYGDSGGNVYTARASVDLPISQELLTRTSLYGINSDGYVHDVTTGQRLNGTNNYGIREAIAVLPSSLSGLRWDVSVDFERNNDANLLNQPGPNGDRISYSGYSRQGGALLPYLTGAKSGFGQGAVVESYGAASNLEWRLGTGTLNIITAYRGLHQELAADFPAAILGPLPTADAVPTGEITLAQNLKNHQVTQEVKWNDTAWDRLNYTTGVFYLYEDNGNNYGQVLGLSPALALPLNDQYFENNTTSVALYAQGDYEVTSHLTATLGVRGTDETKNVVAFPNAPGLGYDTLQIQAAGYPTHLETKQFTPHASLQYRFDPQVMVYASATKGFQGGGWNGLTGTNPKDFNNFGPETIWSYETGVRSTPTPRLRVNATVFYEDVKHYQLLSDNPYTRSFDTSNASDLYAYGLEAEIDWRATESLTLTTNVSSIKAGYYDPTSLITNQQAQCLAGVAGTCDSGIVRANGTLATPVYTPALDLTVGGTYVLALPGVTVTPYLGIHHVASEWFDTANTSGASASWPYVGGSDKARTLVDASVTFAPSGLPLTVTAECKNCTMVNYGTADLLGLDYFNTPGMWDLRLNYTF